MNPARDQLLSIGQAAELLSVSIPTLRRWDQENLLSPIKTPGGQRRYSLEQLEELRGRKRKVKKTHLAHEEPAPEPAARGSKSLFASLKLLLYSLTLAFEALASIFKYTFTLSYRAAHKTTSFAWKLKLRTLNLAANIIFFAGETAHKYALKPAHLALKIVFTEILLSVRGLATLAGKTTVGVSVALANAFLHSLRSVYLLYSVLVIRPLRRMNSATTLALRDVPTLTHACFKGYTDALHFLVLHLPSKTYYYSSKGLKLAHATAQAAAGPLGALAQRGAIALGARLPLGRIFHLPSTIVHLFRRNKLRLLSDSSIGQLRKWQIIGKADHSFGMGQMINGKFAMSAVYLLVAVFILSSSALIASEYMPGISLPRPSFKVPQLSFKIPFVSKESKFNLESEKQVKLEEEPITNNLQAQLDELSAVIADFSLHSHPFEKITLTSDFFSSLDSTKLTGKVPDADHLDGISSSSFLRADASDTAEGAINFTAAPGSSNVGGGPVYINPAASTAGYTLLGVALNDSLRFKVDAEGDVTIAGTLTVDGSSLSLPNDSVTDAMVSDTLTASNLVAASSVVADAEVDDDITLTSTKRITTTLTTEQLRLAYDASNYVTATVGSTGAVTLDATGADAAFTISDALTASDTLTVSGASITASSASLALGGAVTGATTITGSGNINTTGGALQTNSVTRIDNAGVGTFASGTTVGGVAVAPADAGYATFGTNATLTAETDLSSGNFIFQNEIKGWPPYVADGTSLASLWWGGIGGGDTRTLVAISGEAGVTEKYERAIKVVAGAVDGGLVQSYTYADEPRLKSGETVSAIAAVWVASGGGVEISLRNSDLTETVGGAASTAAWNIIKVEGHSLAGTSVSLRFRQVTTAGTFYVVPLGLCVCSKAVALPPRGGRWVERETADVVSAVDPGGVSWTDLDLTTATSPLAWRVELHGLYKNATSTGQVLVRRNGSSAAGSTSVGLVRATDIAQFAFSTAIVAMDDGQGVEYGTDEEAGDTETLYIGVHGYWEWE